MANKSKKKKREKARSLKQESDMMNKDITTSKPEAKKIEFDDISTKVTSKDKDKVDINNLKKMPKIEAKVIYPKIEWSGQKISTFVMALIGIILTSLIAFGSVPGLSLNWWYDQTDYAQEQEDARARDAEASRLNERKIVEDKDIQGKTKATLKTNFGDIVFNLNPNMPITTENFLRIANRDLYDGNPFHRLVKSDGFNVIQGGDFENSNGTGGYAANGTTIVDELWSVAPQYNEEQTQLLNEPVLRDPDAYRDFEILSSENVTGQVIQVTYPKGSVAMAKTAAPNSAGSQFFINLDDTTAIPAVYTIFAQVDESSFPVLDEIFKLNPTSAEDPTPDQEVKIEDVIFE